MKLLKHADSGVRYWGAIGLLAHQEAGVRAGHDELLAALADDSPIVQIMAAEALGRFGSEADAVAALEVLLQYIKPEANYFLAVAAWNALDYLDERVLPALDKIKSLPTNWNRVPPRMGEYPTRLKQKMLADLQKPLGLPHGGFP
jgi:HEAT repeat protein